MFSCTLSNISEQHHYNFKNLKPWKCCHLLCINIILWGFRTEDSFLGKWICSFSLWMSKSSLTYIMANGDGFLLPLTETWSHFCEWYSEFYCTSTYCIAHLFKVENVVLESLAYPVSWNKTMNFIPLGLIGSNRVSAECYALLNRTHLISFCKTNMLYNSILIVLLCLKWKKYYAIFVYFSNYSRILESLLEKKIFWRIYSSQQITLCPVCFVMPLGKQLNEDVVRRWKPSQAIPHHMEWLKETAWSQDVQEGSVFTVKLIKYFF